MQNTIARGKGQGTSTVRYKKLQSMVSFVITATEKRKKADDGLHRKRVGGSLDR